MNKIILSFSIFALSVFSAGQVHAQSSWEQCQDGKTVVHCETYDCPRGDTNGDGSCTTADTGARLTDVRNDSLCANPTSGCGEVRYFPANTASACLVRIEESTNNCNLYSVAIPTVAPRATATPVATTTPTATRTPAPTATASATPIAAAGGGGTTKGGEQLPETGAELWFGAGFILMGVLGVYMYEKFRYV